MPRSVARRDSGTNVRPDPRTKLSHGNLGNKSWRPCSPEAGPPTRTAPAKTDAASKNESAREPPAPAPSSFVRTAPSAAAKLLRRGQACPASSQNRDRAEPQCHHRADVPTRTANGSIRVHDSRAEASRKTAIPPREGGPRNQSRDGNPAE